VVSSDAIVTAFDAAGYRLTEPRRAIARMIGAHRGHFTADDLLAASDRDRLGVGRATVFRSLDILTELGLIERLDLPTGDHTFVACEPTHHHHVVCSSCGRSTDVGDSGIATVLKEVGRRSGYRIESHRVEMFGLCPSCQAARAKRT
jgi:Fur family transcriptional regulator, ferric uptake regulator